MLILFYTYQHWLSLINMVFNPVLHLSPLFQNEKEWSTLIFFSQNETRLNKTNQHWPTLVIIVDHSFSVWNSVDQCKTWFTSIIQSCSTLIKMSLLTTINTDLSWLTLFKTDKDFDQRLHCFSTVLHSSIVFQTEKEWSTSTF